ncbi:MAG TPA: lysylphosphatidylglycerol synthase domain-containing protein [Polyangiaceae bacterium]|nr:lysylphosphatidylglycerol synthase domain-containing protein [Polyangiaceae bacterium]
MYATDASATLPRRTARVGLTPVLALGAAILLARAFRVVDGGATWAALASAGPCAPLALLPFVLAMTTDAAGMLLLLRVLGHEVSLRRLVPIRIATEALHLTAPAGFVVADTATASLLDAQCGVPIGQGAVLAIARKWLVMRAHAAYIAGGVVWGASMLAAVSQRCLGGPWLPWVVGACALAPLALSLGLGSGFRGRPALVRLQTAVARLGWGALSARVARCRASAAAVDGHLAKVGADRASTWAASAAFLACWVLESAETAVIVRLVGGPFDLRLAMAAEIGISMIRSVGNVAPAGLGFQEASYITLLPAMGLPAPIAAAFVLLKRAKELAWIAVGYGLLGAMRRGGSRSARAAGLVQA